jgi:hypothetical protein
MMNRSERRAQRARVIARRRFIYTHVWNNRSDLPCFGRFAKFNLNCGCLMCHYDKYFSDRRKRRDQLKRATSED